MKFLSVLMPVSKFLSKANTVTKNVSNSVSSLEVVERIKCNFVYAKQNSKILTEFNPKCFPINSTNSQMIIFIRFLTNNI